jgi:hypothetical protein
VHVRLFHFSSTLAMVAMRACRHDIRPEVLTAHMARDDMIHSQAAIALPAILAGIIITAEYFTPCELDMRARSMNLILQPDDRGTRD